MKRLWSTPAFALGQERRQRKNARRRAASARKKKRAPTLPRPVLSRKRREVTAPTKLSLFENPEATLAFGNKVRHFLGKANTEVFLDLANVQDFTTDALLLLHAIRKSKTRAANTSISGNLPDRADLATEFKASGFFEGFNVPPAGLPPPAGLMRDAFSEWVEGTTASKLVAFAVERVPVTPTQRRTFYRTFIELMTNTNGHASGDSASGSESERAGPNWFASVYCRGGVAYFSFMDLGVGILWSLSAKDFRRRFRRSILPAHLLETALHGKLGSATGQPGRGLGLPRMRLDAEKGHLSDLQLLTGSAQGSVAEGAYSSLSTEFKGTAIRWNSRT